MVYHLCQKISPLKFLFSHVISPAYFVTVAVALCVHQLRIYCLPNWQDGLLCVAVFKHERAPMSCFTNAAT